MNIFELRGRPLIILILTVSGVDFLLFGVSLHGFFFWSHIWLTRNSSMTKVRSLSL